MTTTENELIPDMTFEEAQACLNEIKTLRARLNELQGEEITDMDFFDLLNEMRMPK